MPMHQLYRAQRNEVMSATQSYALFTVHVSRLEELQQLPDLGLVA